MIFRLHWRRIAAFGLLIISGFVGLGSLFGQEPDLGRPGLGGPADERVSEIKKLISKFADADHFSGVVVVEIGGQRVVEVAAGMADRETREPIELDTPFCVASVTKSLTRAIAIRLLEGRVLGLQDPVSKFVAGFPNGEQLTVESLLRHQAGIPHRVTTDADESNPQTPESMTAIAAKRLENAPPVSGTRIYSSAGYSVLARVLEVASQKTFRDLLSEFMLEPARLTQTWEYEANESRYRAQEYLLDTYQSVRPAAVKDYSFLVGAGSLFSTASDVLKFGNAVLDGVFGESVRLSLQDDEGVFEDNGSTNGYRCYVRIDRKQGSSFVLMSNLESGANDVLIQGINNLLAGQDVGDTTIPIVHVQEKLDPSQWHKFCGTYQLPSGAEFEVSIDGTELTTGSHRLHCVGESKFFSYSNYAEIEFHVQEDGAATGLTWTNRMGPAKCTRK